MGHPAEDDSGSGEVDDRADGMDGVHRKWAALAELAKAGFVGGDVDGEDFIGAHVGLLPMDAAAGGLERGAGLLDNIGDLFGGVIADAGDGAFDDKALHANLFLAEVDARPGCSAREAQL